MRLSWISPSDQMHSWKPIRKEKQTVLYVQCVIGCMIKKEMTLQCEQSALFNLHYSSIHPRQHAKLEQVRSLYLSTIRNFTSSHCTHLRSFRSGIAVVSHHFCTMISISVHVRKLPFVTGNTLRVKVTILLLFLCVGNSKSLVHLVSTKMRVCSPPR